MLTLYIAPGASSMAPHIALVHIGAPFALRSLSFAKREQTEPAYLAINPEGKVPTLVTEDGTLTEVAAILFYLARRFPKTRLLPDDAMGEAQALSWMSFTASTLHPSFIAGQERAEAALGQAEHRLAGQEWAVGGRLSVADIHLFRLFWRMRHTLNLPVENWPGLAAHYDRMMALPAVRATCQIEQSIGYELRGLRVP
ncbi:MULTISPECIES: glutathione S-transferase family protein [unclassified Sphingobium]|uniref:glutathione S-transferase family protein n=1 Tax=unclassified Sphingobium TaxID=2611147 RepID=UPI0022240BF5|nr:MULTISPECIES: glutathione binding-like protein [unclassified Sphingobium]MCW2382187.1 glutathione S-transferase [Sphingobium sp. B2D3B]MCW2397640.1 glutathione S-transferase [Sphingobium sp. B2D3C]